jgi:DNA-binding transcriptional LysR family regulator
LRVSVQESRSFVPEQATKTYRISMTDLTEAVILPHLAGRIRRMAPNINIDSFLIKRRETTKELAAGRLDFAIDAPLNTDTQVRHVKLFEDRHVCVMRKGHPLAKKDKITLDDYLAQSHIHISSRRNGLGHVDLALGKMGIQRRVVMRSQHYQMAPLVLESTDMVMTVHERFAERHDLHWTVLPIEDVPAIETHLFWHESTDQDPANRWMREQIIELSQQLKRQHLKAREAAAAAQH